MILIRRSEQIPSIQFREDTMTTTTHRAAWALAAMTAMMMAGCTTPMTADDSGSHPDVSGTDATTGNDVAANDTSSRDVQSGGDAANCGGQTACLGCSQD